MVQRPQIQIPQIMNIHCTVPNPCLNKTCMKTKIILLIAILTIVNAARSRGQGFVDLNFEQANVAGYAAGLSIPATLAFPGWQVYYGSTQEAQVYYDGLFNPGPSVSIEDTNMIFGDALIQGNYSALLYGGQASSSTLSQTAIVPYGTAGIQLEANEQSGSFVVTINGQTISMTPLQTYSNYTVYVGDISAWAGQDATLSITESPAGSTLRDSLLLDDITFTGYPIPEPSTLALIAMGAAAFGGFTWRKETEIEGRGNPRRSVKSVVNRPVFLCTAMGQPRRRPRGSFSKNF